MYFGFGGGGGGSRGISTLDDPNNNISFLLIIMK